MALNDEFLTQDIDILPDVPVEWGKEEITEQPETEVKAPETEATSELDPELAALLGDVTESGTEQTEEINKAWDKLEEAKEKIEEVQSNPESANAEDLLKEIYQDLLQTETALQASEVAKDVAMSKVSELQAQLSEAEINAAGQSTSDNPDLMIINKLLDAAQGWSETALPRVKDALNKIFSSLYGILLLKNDKFKITLNDYETDQFHLTKEHYQLVKYLKKKKKLMLMI